MIALLLACNQPVVHVPATPGCESLSDGYCSAPFPSDRYLVQDDTTTTGWRVAYPQDALPMNADGVRPDPTEFSRADGMPLGGRMFAVFAKTPDLTPVAWHDDLDPSLADDHPIVLLDLDRGERVPLWAELDAQADTQVPALILNPGVILQPDTRYAVAIRGLQATDGSALPAPVGFQAMRDGHVTDADDLEDRRDRFEALFIELEDHGIARDELQLAWQFHTASADYLHRDLLHMRADALDRLGPDGIGCTVTTVELDFDDGDGTTPVARKVTGTFTVPSYMDRPSPPARMVRDDDGLPAFVELVEVDFTAIVPYALADTGAQGPLLTYGHGLMGLAEPTVSNEAFRDLAEDLGIVIVATDWAGMSATDAGHIALALGDVSKFVGSAERMEQGMINQFALTRSFAGVCADLPELSGDSGTLIDRDQVYFSGGSQGGILGATYMTLAPDVQRGVLFVNGANFPFTMDRSIDFAPYVPIMEGFYPNRLDRLFVLQLTTHWWEWAEPAGWLHWTEPGLDGIDGHEVLSIAAKNDQQVSNLSSDLVARTVGMSTIQGSARTPWGVPVETDAFQGPGYITIDMGDRAPPEGNEWADFNDRGHSTVAGPDATRSITLEFLQTGWVTMPCEGICDPE